MVKLVWQANDGSIFGTEMAADEHDARQNYIDTIAGLLHANVNCVRYSDDAYEIAAYIAMHYNITPK